MFKSGISCMLHLLHPQRQLTLPLLKILTGCASESHDFQ